MKLVSIFALAVTLLGCNLPEKQAPIPVPVLDGPGMVYVDREYRTEYANTLPFDSLENFSYWAVAYLGEGERGKNAAKESIEKLFSELSEEKRTAVEHYDYGGEKWYLVIPRHRDDNDIISGSEEENTVQIASGDAFTINCSGDVKICIHTYGGHELILETDENDRLIHTDEVWDITPWAIP